MSNVTATEFVFFNMNTNKREMTVNPKCIVSSKFLIVVLEMDIGKTNKEIDGVGDGVGGENCPVIVFDGVPVCERSSNHNAWTNPFVNNHFPCLPTRSRRCFSISMLSGLCEFCSAAMGCFRVFNIRTHFNILQAMRMVVDQS